MEFINAGSSLKHLINKNSYINAGIHPLELAAVIGLIKSVKGAENDRLDLEDCDPAFSLDLDLDCIDFVEALEICVVYLWRKQCYPIEAIRALIESRYVHTVFTMPQSRWAVELVDLWDEVFNAPKDTPTNLKRFNQKTGFKRQFKALK